MLAALIIVFREVFEAGLIVGIVLAVTRGVAGRSVWIVGGLAAGIVGACVVAMFAGVISALFQGFGQEMFNAAVLGIAVAMLTWHNVWMTRHGRELAGEMHAFGRAVADGSKSLWALAIVIGLAVLREGSEVVLFLYGVVASNASSALGILSGSAAGLALGALVCFLTYRGLVSIPMRHLFQTTTALITLLAAGMAAQMMFFLENAGVVPETRVLWDSSWLLSETSFVGRALHTLIGYADQPTVLQVCAYAATVIVTFCLIRIVTPRQTALKSAPAE